MIVYGVRFGLERGKSYFSCGKILLDFYAFKIKISKLVESE